ncbi:hypothetical protein QBC42DRAFT_96049 [Cladorrhinum samala]|uniref:Transmembrane protein n=1 Tax=Cladorrhinum samala TaxID=585594 RepID=A0AAV9HKB9_9PEZI|nr:hypothetical protein QBC42DRAFT_96049 [Cladorrhinum samala]
MVSCHLCLIRNPGRGGQLLWPWVVEGGKLRILLNTSLFGRLGGWRRMNFFGRFRYSLLFFFMFSVVFIVFVCLGLRGYLFLLHIGRGDFRTYSFMKMFCLQHDCKVFFIIWFFDFFFAAE